MFHHSLGCMQWEQLEERLSNFNECKRDADDMASKMMSEALAAPGPALDAVLPGESLFVSSPRSVAGS